MNVAAENLNPLRATSVNPPEQKERLEKLSSLKQACSGIESLFVTTLIKAMREAGPEGGLLPEAAGSEVYESIADQQFAQYMTEGSGIGLGQMIFNQMARRENLEDMVDQYPQLDNLNYQMAAAPALMQRLGSPASPGPAPELP